MSGKLIELRKPDPKAIREFADRIEGMEKAGATIRSTIMICVHDDDFFVQCHTEDRLSTTIGLIELVKIALIDDGWDALD